MTQREKALALARKLIPLHPKDLNKAADLIEAALREANDDPCLWHPKESSICPTCGRLDGRKL